MTPFAMTPELRIEDVVIPRFLYGTAWKEDATRRLCEMALASGFRGIDTANQRRHYHEAAVGEAVTQSVADGALRREDLFLQTKFTFRESQDERCPYDPSAPIADQVRSSFASSLEHLGVDRVDSYLLHGPSRRTGLGPSDWSAWRAIEAIHASGQARLVGVSNFSRDQLAMLLKEARVGPSFVQNRCYASRGWDRETREFCAAHGIAYQGFSLLTANTEVLSRPEIVRLAKKYGRGVGPIVFRFAMDVGMIVLTGTSDPNHAREDLAALDFRLTPEEIRVVEGLGSMGR